MEEALKLIRVAASASGSSDDPTSLQSPPDCSSRDSMTTSQSVSSGQPPSSLNTSPNFFWTQGLIRPASSPKQARDFIRAIGQNSSPLTWPTAKSSERDGSTAASGSGAGTSALGPGLWEQLEALKALRDPLRPADSVRKDLACLSPNEAQRAVKGLSLPEWITEAALANTSTSQEEEPTSTSYYNSSTAEGKRINKDRQPRTRDGADKAYQQCAALYIGCGVVLDVPKYLERLWAACQVPHHLASRGMKAGLIHAS